jgi:PAS domain S-box-containing protein
MRKVIKDIKLTAFTVSGEAADPLFLVLVLATLVLTVSVVYGLAGLFGVWQSNQPLFSLENEGGLSVLAQVWAIVSLFLFMAVSWALWILARRRHADQIRLRRSEQRYRNIINHAGEAIFQIDESGRILEWNKAAESLFAAPRRNVLGKLFRDIHLCYGVEIDSAMADASRLNRSLTFEFPLRRRGLHEHGQISLTVSPVAAARGAGGKIDLGREKNYVVIARDITSEKQLETRMSETEKLAGIGQFAAGIAHQLNTPLGSILLSAQMLEETIDNEDELEDAQRIIRQTEQCRTIIKGLLNFARPSGRQKGLVMLAEVVRETIFLMEKTIRTQNVKVALDFDDEGMVYGNRNEVEQVIFNLLANALDALPDGGQVSISISNSGDREVDLLFTDSGPGIPEEQRDQIFLPFYTTKEYGKGTGLGLSIVARIVHEHGGHIELTDRDGACFRMTFPLFRPAVHGTSPYGGLALVDDLGDDLGNKETTDEEFGPQGG